MELKQVAEWYVSMVKTVLIVPYGIETIYVSYFK